VSSEAAAGPSSSHRLRRDAIGLWGVVFLVVASAAPLTSMLGAVPAPLAIGDGIGAPGAWLLTGIVLLLFAVGYATMSRFVTNAGAFYAYIARGLGRPAGVGAAMVAVLSYNVIQCALFGLFGFFAKDILAAKLGLHAEWYVWAFLFMAVTAALGFFGIDVSAKVLGVLLLLEVTVLAILDVAVVLAGGDSGLALHSFSPSEIFSGAPGVAFIFAFATFVGFEATAIYGEETKDPKRTVPLATYVAVAVIAGFYSLSSWAIIQAYGEGDAVKQATENGGTFFFAANDRYVGHFTTSLMEWLLLTSIFAALLAFHNAASRYFFTMGREGLLPRSLSRTHPRFGSPARAGVLQISIAFAITLVFVLAGKDPYAALFAWFSGVAALGIIGLQCLTSISVIAFFRRTRLDTRPWNTAIAPGLGALGLAVAFYFGVANWDALTGATSGWVQWLWLSVPAFFAAGVGWAYAVRSRDPAGYERLGHFIDEAPPIEPASRVEEERLHA
jgi:amino acid transporter